MKAWILTVLLGAGLAVGAGPAAVDPAAAEVLQRDQLKLLGAVQDWSDYLLKIQPPVRDKYTPELAQIKAAAEAAKAVDELKPLELRLDAWKRALLYELFPAMSQAWGRTPESVALAQAQVEAFQALQKLEGTALSGMKKKAVADLKSRVSTVSDPESLARLFDNAGFSRPAPLPQAVYSAAPPAAGVQAQAALKIAEPPQSKAPLLLKSDDILTYLDWKKAKELAQEAWDGAKRFTGRCYAYVKDALDSVLPSGWRSDVGQASAYQFAKSLNGNTRLFDKLKLRKIDAASLPGGVPPVGSIVVYGRGMCGFSSKHGHIEIVVSVKPPRACSDGCESMTPSVLSCIKKNSSRSWVNVYVPVNSPAR